MAVKKTKGVYFKATPEELERINLKARELHMTKSELLRRALFAYDEVWDGSDDATHVAIDFGTWRKATVEVSNTMEEVQRIRADVSDLETDVQTLIDEGLIREHDGTVALWNLSKFDKNLRRVEDFLQAIHNVLVCYRKPLIAVQSGIPIGARAMRDADREAREMNRELMRRIEDTSREDLFDQEPPELKYGTEAYVFERETILDEDIPPADGSSVPDEKKSEG